jgi:fido (protein-threonine AMPylation protein)
MADAEGDLLIRSRSLSAFPARLDDSTSREASLEVIDHARGIINHHLASPALWAGVAKKEILGSARGDEMKRLQAAFNRLARSEHARFELTEEWVREIHRWLLQTAAYRTIRVHIGENRTFPDPSEVPARMAALLHGLRQRSEHPAAHAIRAHLGLVTVHPFVDGNGRTARLVAAAILMKSGFRSTLFTILDQHFRDDLSEYVDAIRCYEFRRCSAEESLRRLLRGMANNVLLGAWFLEREAALREACARRGITDRRSQDDALLGFEYASTRAGPSAEPPVAGVAPMSELEKALSPAQWGALYFQYQRLTDESRMSRTSQGLASYSLQMLERMRTRAGTLGEARVAMAFGDGLVLGDEPAPAPFVYAVGRVEARFPSLSIEQEFGQAAGRIDTAGLTQGQVLHAVLSKRENRYLVRHCCWVMTIEGVEAYILQPRDPADVDALLGTLLPAARARKLDVVIGSRGPVASPSLCNGLQVPIVSQVQVYSFDVEGLIKALPRPESMAPELFELAAEELFRRIVRLADNAGGTDEHRALNYLIARYPNVYVEVARAFARNAALSAVEVRPSPLSGRRQVVDVIFSFTDRRTDVIEKSFTRVDVTEEFPFLVTKLSPYYDR